jgi:hypothetical protein
MLIFWNWNAGPGICEMANPGFSKGDGHVEVKTSIFLSHFKCKIRNFITVDHFENIGREKKKWGGASKSTTDHVLQSI